MDIKIENKTLNCFNLCQTQEKRIIESVEAVVPDICGDISRVSSTLTDIYLKSKEVNNGRLEIRGEAQATVLYINETEDGVDYVKLTKAFTIECDCDEDINDSLTHCRLSIANYETRVLNPRKISVSFEILCQIDAYKECSMCVQDSIEQVDDKVIYTLPVSCETFISRVINEKTFSLTEQYIIPMSGITQANIINVKAFCVIDSTQIIGTKLIVKGSVFTHLFYKNDNTGNPSKLDFSSPFSQVIDTGFENLSDCDAHVELTSMYYELIDTISGEKALDLELHAVMMFNASECISVNYIGDAYCNTAVIDYKCDKVVLAARADKNNSEVEFKSSVEVSEDCDEVLCAAFTLNRIDKVSQNINAEIGVDIFYRKMSGEIASVHRVIASQQSLEDPFATLTNYFMLNDEYIATGNTINATIKLLLCMRNAKSLEMNRISTITINEENNSADYDSPTFSVVRIEGESLWELAKKYNSSEEYIKEYNDTETIENKMLLIPKAP